jgi:hypothetical protein
MDKRLGIVVAAVGGIVVGVAGTSAWLHAQAAPPNTSCIAGDPAVDAKSDAIVKQLHAHDHDPYAPQAVAPIGELPKPTKAESSSDSVH